MSFNSVLLRPLALAAVAALGAAAPSAGAHRLVIVGTNDTHSQIDPDDLDGRGGAVRRMVVIDSIRDAARAAGDEVLLVDMGDPVQGTLFFNVFGGEVENRVMNAMGYDIRILGNHEFDNGMERLAQNLEGVTADLLSTNYRFDDPALAARFKPYLIKEIGARKVGFIGVNLRPKGMIAEGNYDGVTYLDALEAADATAWHLKNNEGVWKVIALTHIGNAPTGTGTSDRELAASTGNIDLIMGGHSHTVVDPAATGEGAAEWKMPTARGDSIVVTQAGKAGKYVAVVELDLADGDVGYKLLPVDGRYDDRAAGDAAAELEALIAPYRRAIAEVMNKPVGKTASALDKDSDALLNLTADFVRDRGRQLDRRVDFGLVNKGGIRRGLPKGTITQGQIQTMLPFNNKVVVLEIKGRDILDNFEVMAMTDGNGVSGEVEVVYEPAQSGPRIKSATVGGKPIEADKTYYVATIDYLAGGGDYMTPLTRGVPTATSDDILYVDFLDALTRGAYKGKALKPSGAKRFHLPLP